MATIEAVRTSETSVYSETTRRYILEDCKLQSMVWSIPSCACQSSSTRRLGQRWRHSVSTYRHRWVWECYHQSLVSWLRCESQRQRKAWNMWWPKAGLYSDSCSWWMLGSTATKGTAVLVIGDGYETTQRIHDSYFRTQWKDWKILIFKSFPPHQ
jgi:hypothetical protein